MTKGQRALRVFLVLAAAGLALVTAFTLAARLWWAFDLFSHFRVQYVAAALCLGAVALAVRAYPSAAVLALVVLVHGFAIKDLWLGGTASAAAGGDALRVVSLNVYSANRTPEKVLDFVRATDADLVVLIDAEGSRWKPVLRAMRKLYPHQAARARRVMLFSRHPIRGQQILRPAGGGRPFLVAEIALGDETLVVAGVHPSSPSPIEPAESRRRNRVLEHLAEVVANVEHPVIVAGDFNTTPWSPHYWDLLARSGLRNAAEGKGHLPTWPTSFWPVRIPIDHVLIKGPLAATSVRRGPDVGSDHFPIVADLRLLDHP